MKSKLIPIPYTVGIIKPHIALKEDKVNLFTNNTYNRLMKSCKSLIRTILRFSTLRERS